MHQVSVAAAVNPSDIAAARELFREYAASLPIDLEYQQFSEELAALPGLYAPPSGVLLLGRVAEDFAACVAVRRIDAHVCEMKRLYVRPAYRGHGIASALVQSALAHGRAIGYHEMWLDTLPHMRAAHALYAKHGFNTIAAYGSGAAPGTQYYGVPL